MREALKVGVSGVRGVVGQSLTPQIATGFAQAFGMFVGKGPVVVGRDTRPTGRMIEHAVVAGLQSVGCRPVLVGIAPSPSILVLTKHLQARGGIAITASHNEAPWNALKFVGRNGLYLNETQAEELFDIYHQQEFHLVPEEELQSVRIEERAVSKHFASIYDYVNSRLIQESDLKVAVDCCNGVGALHAEPFLDLFGCDVRTLHDDPSGQFERDPEPLPENLDALKELVVREECDVGFAQDPDGDRLAIVDENGVALGEDLTLAFAIQQVLGHHEDGPVAVNLSASKCIDDVARQYGSTVSRTKTGEINVSEHMLEIGAVVGGENNGGVIIPRIHPCRDSFAGMAIVLELMAVTGKTISQLRDAIPRYVVVKKKIPLKAESAPYILRTLRHRYEGERINLVDGVHVDFGDRWLHVRRSNTEPVLRITAEAPERAEAERMANEVCESVQRDA